MNSDKLESYIGYPLASSTLIMEQKKSKVVLRPYNKDSIDNKYIDPKTIYKGLVSERISFWEERLSSELESSPSDPLKICENNGNLKKQCENCSTARKCSTSGSYCSQESLYSRLSSASERQTSSSGVASMSNSNSDQEDENNIKKLDKLNIINEQISNEADNIEEIENNDEMQNNDEVDNHDAVENTVEGDNADEVENTNEEGDKNVLKNTNTNIIQRLHLNKRALALSIWTLLFLHELISLTVFIMVLIIGIKLYHWACKILC